MDAFRAEYSAGQAKDKLKEVLKGYLACFHWSWPLEREPLPNEQLDLDTDLSLADKARKSAEIDCLRGVSVANMRNTPNIVQSLECWLKTRVELEKTTKNSLKAAVAKPSAEIMEPSQDSTTVGSLSASKASVSESNTEAGSKNRCCPCLACSNCGRRPDSQSLVSNRCSVLVIQGIQQTPERSI